MTTAICLEACTTPQHGFVEEGQRVDFNIGKWDLKKRPYLKRFEKAQADTTKAKEKPAQEPVSSPDSKDDPIVEALGKRVHAMSPDELDAAKAKEIGKAYDIPWQGRSKTDVVSDALKIDGGQP